MKNFKSIILSLIILILITYPASPVFFLAYFNNIHEFYFIYLFIIVILTLNEWRFKRKSLFFYNRLLKFSIFLQILVPIITFILIGNPTALRDFSTILVFVIIFFYTHDTFKERLIHHIVYCFSFFVIISIIVSLS